MKCKFPSLSDRKELDVLESDTNPKRSRGRFGGFTLIQLLVVLSILAVLAAITMGVFGRGRETSRRAQCDMQLKAISLALDAFRQENGHYPAHLSELTSKKYLQAANALRCPNEVRPTGSYDEYYAPRASRDTKELGELAMVLCPLHEHFGAGAQAYKGRYTRQFAASPAKLTQANGVSVERPDGKGPIAATSGQILHGGDRLRVGSAATIEFADGTTCELGPGSDLTVLQSFLEGANANQSPLYTLVRQTVGRVRYRIHHGSKFDVVTPTATAGARGTDFVVEVAAGGEVKIVTMDQQSIVFVSTRDKTVKAILNQPVSILGGVLNGGIDILGGLGGILGGIL